MQIKELEYAKFTLPNGIRCILYQRSEIHSVHISVDVNVGALDEDSSTNGLSHFIEHLPFDGTKEFKTWEAVDEFNNEISGSSNAYTAYRHTRYYGYYPYQYMDQAFFYLSQLVFHPTHKQEDIDKEREIILDELKKQNDTTGHKIFRNIIDPRYTDKSSSYSYDIVGTEENLKNFTKKDIEDFYNRHYIPENMQIFVVGNFDLEEIKKIINKYFYKDIKDRHFGSKVYREFEETYPDYSNFAIQTSQKKDVDQLYLTMTFPSFEFKKYSQEQRIIVPFLKSITASSQFQQSILWKRLREELGIVYDVSAYGYDFFNRAFLTIQTSFSPKYLETALKEIYEGINKIKNEKVNDSVFESRKKRIMDTELMSYDYPSNVLSWIMDQEDEMDYHNQMLSPEQFINLIKSYKFEQVIRTGNAIYDWNKLNIGVLSKEDPKEMEKEVAGIWKKVTKKK